MLSKFAIDYIVRPQHNTRVSTHFTDDPIEVEEFLMHLLLARTHIKCIRHDGADLSRNQFDQMLKKAAERLASSLIREAIGIDAAQVKDRFGFAA